MSLLFLAIFKLSKITFKKVIFWFLLEFQWNSSKMIGGVEDCILFCFVVWGKLTARLTLVIAGKQWEGWRRLKEELTICININLSSSQFTNSLFNNFPISLTIFQFPNRCYLLKHLSDAALPIYNSWFISCLCLPLQIPKQTWSIKSPSSVCSRPLLFLET